MSLFIVREIGFTSVTIDFYNICRGMYIYFRRCGERGYSTQRLYNNSKVTYACLKPGDYQITIKCKRKVEHIMIRLAPGDNLFIKYDHKIRYDKPMVKPCRLFWMYFITKLGLKMKWGYSKWIASFLAKKITNLCKPIVKKLKL